MLVIVSLKTCLGKFYSKKNGTTLAHNPGQCRDRSRKNAKVIFEIRYTPALLRFDYRRISPNCASPDRTDEMTPRYNTVAKPRIVFYTKLLYRPITSVPLLFNVSLE